MDDFVFACVANNSGPIDVLFIHGLSGHPVDTWTCKDSADKSGDYWPKWIAEDVPAANIYTLGYPAGLFAKWADKEMNLYERSKVTLEYLSSYDIGIRPIAIVAHSLGGLLAKQVIRTGLTSGDEDWNAIAHKIGLMFFLATPHTGASLAALLSFAFPRTASEHVELLKPGNAHIDELNQAYRVSATANSIKTVAFYEKHATKKVSLVVDKVSADPGVPGCVPIPIDANHETICKPKDRHQVVYRSLVKHLKRYATGCIETSSISANDEPLLSPFSADDYTDPAAHDRRDLQQKLIDAGREHEYLYANDAQNKFARDYISNGLNNTVRTMHDDILAEVEQRFNLHVYSSKICAGASLSEISDAVQTQVINPIVEKYKHVSRFNSQVVIRAMYYLTEKCFISWNPR